MSTLNNSKLNWLLRSQPENAVLTSSWLVKEGYSYDLQKRYRKSKWFDSIGTGALIRHGKKVDYLAGVHALQSQLGLSVHPGGKTALSLQGKSHYLEVSAKRAQLFGTEHEKLPSWFRKYHWGLELKTTLSSFLPPDLGLIDFEHKGFKVKISSPARAILECLYQAPQKQPLLEVYELMEGLNNLRPAAVNKLLKNCTSVKVKRLFLYMAEKAEHAWFDYIKIDELDLGSGKRSIVKNGVYVPKYKITVPKEIEENNG